MPRSDFGCNQFLGEPVVDNFVFERVTPLNVVAVVGKLKSSSSGPDEIPTDVIKKVIGNINTVLTHIINLSFETGLIPDDIKTARVSPIFKSGDPCSLSNYRPISVLSTFSKIIESIVVDQLENFLNINDVISDSQYGFRKQRSTELAVMKLTNDIHGSFERGSHTAAVFIDLSKAFDTVQHEILLEKLNHYGIRNIANYWFRNYLINRKQFVKFNNTFSAEKYVMTGVPLGSTLGPILFNLYINDITNSSIKIDYIMYADDCVLYIQGIK